jgi:hypothetical protein
MEKIKYSVARAAIMLVAVFVGTCVAVDCSEDDKITSNFDDVGFIEKLSDYE